MITELYIIAPWVYDHRVVGAVHYSLRVYDHRVAHKCTCNCYLTSPYCHQIGPGQPILCIQQFIVSFDWLQYRNYVV